MYSSTYPAVKHGVSISYYYKHTRRWWFSFGCGQFEKKNRNWIEPNKELP